MLLLLLLLSMNNRARRTLAYAVYFHCTYYFVYFITRADLTFDAVMIITICFQNLFFRVLDSATDSAKI